MKNRTITQSRFASIAAPKKPRSVFDRSSGWKGTFDAGKLIPIYVDEALPGDTFNLTATVFGRLNTPVKPFMDNLMIDVHFFSVPERLLWTNWKKMNGEQDNPDDSIDFTMPVITTPSGGYGEQSLADYFGIPTKEDIGNVRASAFRAYNQIFNRLDRDWETKVISK